MSETLCVCVHASMHAMHGCILVGNLMSHVCTLYVAVHVPEYIHVLNQLLRDLILVF